jgi:hypothetical protein
MFWDRACEQKNEREQFGGRHKAQRGFGMSIGEYG